jgi:hypothetical protein
MKVTSFLCHYLCSYFYVGWVMDYLNIEIKV